MEVVYQTNSQTGIGHIGPTENDEGRRQKLFCFVALTGAVGMGKVGNNFFGNGFLALFYIKEILTFIHLDLLD